MASCRGIRETAIERSATQYTKFSCMTRFISRGLESISSSLLATHGDVRLQCKAANALGSLCMSKDVARSFPATASSSAVLDRCEAYDELMCGCGVEVDLEALLQNLCSRCVVILLHATDSVVVRLLPRNWCCSPLAPRHASRHRCPCRNLTCMSCPPPSQGSATCCGREANGRRRTPWGAWVGSSVTLPRKPSKSLFRSWRSS